MTYASIGYGDVLLEKSWRILGAIEGATGVIMLVDSFPRVGPVPAQALLA